MSFSFDFCEDEYDGPVAAASTIARRETHENECKVPAHELLISNLLRFFAGGWDSLELGKPADILLSSETTYSLETIPSLCRALQMASWPTKENDQEGIDPHTSLCLIASKVLYFGVGGGIEPFRSEVLAHHGWCKQIGWSP
ncbi:protein-histidine N-methyltransferase [Malassezia equina]|uniref:Protein-histidine N-methyltransferase n=1 Tax=Malassezia equina TaxID=1381935 RepID=A0AAF0EEM8_9BASI|nr:protein-histidine N-methyltransferase [Malassezia equina]